MRGKRVRLPGVLMVLLMTSGLPSDAVGGQSSPTKAPTGLGVPRQSIQSLFEKPNIGFVFEPTTPIAGQPRVLGVSKDLSALLELLGPEANLLSASLLVRLPRDRESVRAQNALYLLVFVLVAAPEWKAAGDWITQHIHQVTEQREMSITHGRYAIRMIGSEQIGIYTITVKPAAKTAKLK